MEYHAWSWKSVPHCVCGALPVFSSGDLFWWKFTAVLWGLKKSPYGKCTKSQTAITSRWGRLRENGYCAKCITTPHHKGPPGTHWWYTVYYSVKVQGLTFTLRVNTFGCFLIPLQVLFLVQYVLLVSLLLLWGVTVMCQRLKKKQELKCVGYLSIIITINNGCL